jgi:NAD(P)-dependent dehydrogenase (short-subunit alcohol dehydrogenase family)
LDIFDLRGHVAVVTGGNGGIGLAMAKGLAKAGANVALWARNAEKNAAALDALCGLGCDAEAFACDVANEDDVVATMARTLERFGRVDSCFANAGIGLARPFLDMTVEDWDAVMQVNLVGAFVTFREVLKHVVTRGGGGKLVGIASVGSIHGIPRGQNYSASKAGICALVRSIAVEFARYDVQANAILPGWIDTDMTVAAQKWDKLNDAVLSRTPLKRWGKPEDFEGIAVYLASPASRFHTGDVIRIDGGYAIF